MRDLIDFKEHDGHIYLQNSHFVRISIFEKICCLGDRHL